MPNRITRLLNKAFPTGYSNPIVQPDGGNPAKNLSNYIAPVQLQRIRQDVLSWRAAITEAENVWYPHRVKMQQLYVDTKLNAHVASCVSRRKDLTLLRKWEFVDKAGKIDQITTDIFTENIKGKSQNQQWFGKFLDHSLDTIFFGYSLISLGDIVNDAFPNISTIRRWNVSPDRFNVANFTYSISGANFLDQPYKDWHVYVKTSNDIGTSDSGYGLFYEIAVYEIFLRNLLGYNGDFVELYAQPYRVGKTNKTEEKERAEFAAAIQQMGSAGWALIDPEDEIDFKETALGGTGYKSYDNLEQRCEKKISKMVLGHADAIDSVPGKLGSGTKKTPAEIATEDKQTKDGSFISSVVNDQLMANMRNLGFNINPETKAVLKNDAEVMETNNQILDMAVKMSLAGLQMDAKYFTDNTGIPVTAPPAVPPPQPFTPSIKNKLERIYGKHKAH
jgi:phage gp29-like protein